MVKKVIVFDVDGTLFDTRKGIIETFNYVLDMFEKGHIPIEEECKYIGPPVKQVFMDYIGLNEIDAENAAKIYRKIYVDKYIYNTRLYSNVREILNELKVREYNLCIATMKTKMQIDKLFQLFDLKYEFNEIQVAREDGSVSKTQMLYNIINKYGEADYYMVGDTLNDYKASVSAKMKFIAADYGYGDWLEYEEIIKIEKFSQLLSIVG